MIEVIARNLMVGLYLDGYICWVPFGKFCGVDGFFCNGADTRKRRKYAVLPRQFQFEPIVLDTTGVIGASTSRIVKAIGRRLVKAT